jgi:hypothetical protein
LRRVTGAPPPGQSQGEGNDLLTLPNRMSPKANLCLNEFSNCLDNFNGFLGCPSSAVDRLASGFVRLKVSDGYHQADESAG